MLVNACRERKNIHKISKIAVFTAELYLISKGATQPLLKYILLVNAIKKIIYTAIKKTLSNIPP